MNSYRLTGLFRCADCSKVHQYSRVTVASRCSCGADLHKRAQQLMDRK